MNKEKKLLVLDTSYSLEDIYKRGIIKSVTCRDIDGYFSHVWTVHPFATLVTSPSWSEKFGKPVWHSLTGVHTFIEGKIGRYKWLRWLGPLNFLLSQINLISTLKHLIKKENISVIRAGDMLYLGLLAWLLSRSCKISFVVRVGGNHDKVFETTGQPMQKRIFFNRKIEKKVEHFVLSRADLVAGANQDNLNFALANGARKNYCTIFRYGNLLYEGHFIEPQKRKEGISLLNEISITPYSFLLYIGRLEEVKHPDHVIKVLADVRKNNHDIKALFVGDGTMLDKLKNIATAEGVEQDVVFAGNQNQEWLSRIIPLAAVVLSPHTGRALSEAALAGVPVAAYDIDWQSEMIENEVTGLLVPHPDQKQLSKATEQLLTDKQFAEKVGSSLRTKAVNMLNPEQLNLHEIAEYEKLFERHKQQIGK
jgi:glycosyltransferase involved in cell wall biosynthesis